ncbi:MAG: Ig-like domain-containing protein [Eubacteriales bacterium]|nr:Ig-like domain-containing protein [Eubacteriales bacterium]
MKRNFITFALLAVLCFGLCLPALAVNSTAPGDIASPAEWALLELINDYRAEEGRQPLSMSGALQTAANTRAVELKTMDDKNRPDGKPWASVLEEAGFSYVSATQSYMKNLTDDKTAPAAIINTLRTSEQESVKPFREAILAENITHIGIGSADGNWLWILTEGGCTPESCTVSCQSGALYSEGADISKLAMVANVQCNHGATYLPVSSSLCKTSGADAYLQYKTAAGTQAILPAVQEIPVELTLSSTTAQIIRGESFALSAEVKPVSAVGAFQWSSSDPSIASVDSYGLVIGRKAGTATITVTFGKATASCAVTVTDIADSISCSVSDLFIGVGQKYSASYVLTPAGCAERVTWTTYPQSSSAASVSEEGVITAGPSTGKVYVVATTASGKSARIRVTVLPSEKAVQSVRISTDKAEVVPGGQIRIAAKVYPSTASYKQLTWVSSNPAVASVTSDGVITGLTRGESTITVVSSSGASASCRITVKDHDITSVSFRKSSATIYAGKQGKLPPTITPATAPASALVWTSSDPTVASVDQNGVVTAHKKGIVQITASASEKVSASIIIHVKEIEVSALKLSKRSVTTTVGASGTIRAQVAPTNATNKNILWKSSAPEVVSVDADGRITALSTGTAVITATSESNPNVKTSCTIKVIANAYKRTGGDYKPGKPSAWITDAQFVGNNLVVRACYYNSKPYAVLGTIFGNEALLYTSNTVVAKRLPIDELDVYDELIPAKSAQYVVYVFSLEDYPELRSLNLRALHSNSRIG